MLSDDVIPLAWTTAAVNRESLNRAVFLRPDTREQRYLSALKAVYNPCLSALYSYFAYSVLSTGKVDAF